MQCPIEPIHRAPSRSRDGVSSAFDAHSEDSAHLVMKVILDLFRKSEALQTEVSP